MLLIAALAALFTQTPWCRDLVRTIALNAVNDAIRGSVRIGRLEGNLLTSLELNDVFIIGEGDTVAAIRRLRLRYDLSGILRGAVEVDSLFIDSARLSLRQNDDGKWNLLTAFAPARTREEIKEDTARSTFSVRVKRFDISDALIRTSPWDTATLLPREVRLSIGGSGSYTESRQQIAVTMMKARLSHPDIAVTGCTFSADHAGGSIRLLDFVLTTPANRIELSGTLTEADTLKGSATVNASLPDLTEFGSIVPADFRSMHPEVQATVGIDGEQLYVRCLLRDGRQSLRGTGNLTLAQVPVYAFAGEFQHLDPGVLRSAVPEGVDLNGTLEFRGEGFHTGDAVARGKADFTDSRVGANRIRRLQLGGEYGKGMIAATGKLDVEPGVLAFEARGDVRAAPYRFSITAESHDLDIAPLLHRRMSSRITMHMRGTGTGRDIAHMEGDFRGSVSRSMIGGYSIDSAHVHVRALNGNFSVDSSFVSSSIGEVRVSGDISRHGNISASFGGTVCDTGSLGRIINVRRLAAEGTFGGAVEGKMDSLVAVWNMSLRSPAFNELSAAAIEGSGRLILERGIPMVSGRADVKGLRHGDLAIESLIVQGEYGAGSARATVQAQDSTRFALSADVTARIDTTVALTIRELDVAQGNSRWSNGKQPIAVSFSGGSVDIRGVNLTSTSGSLAVEGLIAHGGETHLECTVHNVDLLPFSRLIDTAFTSLGPVDARVSVAGRMDNPAIEGILASSRIAYGGWGIDSLSGSFAVRDSTFRWDITAGLNRGNHVRISGYLPVQFGGTGGIINRTRPMDIHLVAPRLDLSTTVRSLGPFDMVKGILAADIDITDSLQSPRALGTISIAAGSLQSTSLGLSYGDIALMCTGKGDLLVIDSLCVRGGKGVLTAGGTVGPRPGLTRGKGGPTNIRITASEFEIANTANYAASLNGTATIRNEGDTYLAEGDLVLERSHIYLPYVTKKVGTGEREHSPPMLVAATRRDTASGGSLAKKQAAAGLAETDSMQRFNGRIRLTIPRGTWVRGKSLNLELSGTLEIVKRSPAIELIGFIRCERGTYEFYGKKFQVKEGRLDFDGGKEINPTIAAEMRYEFRDAYEQQQTLKMMLTNRIKNMTIRFTLGDEPISDGDAVSYLLFGRRSDELSQSQQNGLANIGEVVAKDFAAGLVSAQLSSTVGDWAGLDVVRISGEDNWQKATFTAGKYVTADIYASYERGLFSSDPNDPITEIARLEYHFVRSMYIRLTKASDTSSGADLILQIQ